MGAREYDPRLGRWLSADTIVPGSTNPQSWNRFAYVYNNPLKYVDPSEHHYVDDPIADSNRSLDWRYNHGMLAPFGAEVVETKRKLAKLFDAAEEPQLSWQVGDIILASQAENGAMGYWAHSVGIVGRAPTDGGAEVIALPPWHGAEVVGWQWVTVDQLDYAYIDWVVLRVQATPSERAAAAAWAEDHIGTPFASMYPRPVVWVGDKTDRITPQRNIEEYPWFGWLDPGPGLYCFELPIEAYQKGAGLDITGRSDSLDYIDRTYTYASTIAMAAFPVVASGVRLATKMYPYTGDEIFYSEYTFVVDRKE